MPPSVNGHNVTTVQLSYGLVTNHEDRRIRKVRRATSISRSFRQANITSRFRFRSKTSNSRRQTVNLPLTPPVKVITISTRLNVLRIGYTCHTFTFATSGRRIRLLHSHNLGIGHGKGVRVRTISNLSSVPLPITRNRIFLNARIHARPVGLHREARQRHRIVIRCGLTQRQGQSTPSLLMYQTPIFPR